MKFANYALTTYGTKYVGDYMQIMAIDHLYSSHGVDLNDVVYISLDRLADYDGEYVVLPISMPLVNYVEGGLARRFSSHIIPVFLGLTMIKDSLTTEEIAYLNHYSPIGCRDEKTLNVVRKYGIPSFLFGCITLTLPERIDGSGTKVYIVDVQDEVFNLIPENIRKSAIYVSHTRPDNPDELDVSQLTYNIYDDYKQNASLVITSLMHCALPCFAAGIPVVFLADRISYRFSWFEKIITIYNRDNVDEINWDSVCNKSFFYKNKMADIAFRLISERLSDCIETLDISYFFENRNKNVYINDAVYEIKKFIDYNWTDKSKSYKYSFWGMTQVVEWIYEYIQCNYPNARLCHIYDGFRKLSFKGIDSLSPDLIVDNIDEIVFVTSAGAVSAAIDLFKKIGKKNDTYAYVNKGITK